MRRKKYQVELLENPLIGKQADPSFLFLSRKDGYDGLSFRIFLDYEDKGMWTMNMKDLGFLTTW